MKRAHVNLAVLLAAVAALAACDQRTPLMPGTGGGSGGGTPGRPTISIDTLRPSPVNIGDSVFIAVHARDDQGVVSIKLQGLTVNGSIDLGTLTTKDRYAPLTTALRTGLRDTVIRRYLQPNTPVDTSLDSMVVVATATDNLGNVGADTAVVRMVSGPHVEFVVPTSTTKLYAGSALDVKIHATHPDGISTLNFSATNTSGTWPTPLNATATTTMSPAPKDTIWVVRVNVPTDAPEGGRLTFTASGIDVNGKPGSQALITLPISKIDTIPPLVTQVVSPRIELTDSVSVTASVSTAIAQVGVVIMDSVGAVITQQVLSITPASIVQQWVPLGLTSAVQGKHLRISSFAIDRFGRTGYSVPQNTSVVQTDPAKAWFDTTVVVYGRTYRLPNSTVGTVVGDIAVDPVYGNVFLSNINANRLEIWNNQTRSFAPSGVRVGSQPWGLAVSNSPDTLYVANSGGTNISRVFIGSANPTSIQEVLSQRILTRNTYLFDITQVRDEKTGKVSISAAGPISYSDRPQYLAVSAGGRVFYSTRPTVQAPAGTIRWLDPKLQVPDPRQIWQYGSSTGSSNTEYALFNVDSLKILRAPANSAQSDIVTLYDHPYGALTGTIVVSDSDVVAAVASMNAQNSDAELIGNLDINSLALSDTTFIGVSSDRTWVGFGEGNTSSPGRIMLVNDPDPASPEPPFFSPAVAVADLLDNASERVYGLAIDSTGQTVASHGDQSYFAEISAPFHLRLQGKFDSFDNGAGIAFHPGANGYQTVSSDRLAFVGSQNGEIEIVDIAYFLSRGKLTLKGNLYGPLRATRPLPGDSDPGVILKLFGLTSEGLVVIDLRATDIQPAP
ncbi:MAG TPA: hypothetical protein VJU87_00350 [Gemmatimonadaceae bacterium]|nr:hypothetical protein [Gemmatimonadaceae bacterium]